MLKLLPCLLMRVTVVRMLVWIWMTVAMLPAVKETTPVWMKALTTQQLLRARKAPVETLVTILTLMQVMGRMQRQRPLRAAKGMIWR
ncbi:hypothetical protein D3C73_1428880 [compost metagenome]